MKKIYEKIELEIKLFVDNVVTTSEENDNLVDFPDLPENM